MEGVEEEIWKIKKEIKNMKRDEWRKEWLGENEEID